MKHTLSPRRRRRHATGVRRGTAASRPPRRDSGSPRRSGPAPSAPCRPPPHARARGFLVCSSCSFTEWFDLYGGPLFAFTSAQLTDPFNTRVNGGTPVNYLGGVPGGFLGTELDLGASVRFSRAKYFNVSATLEGGVLLPGDAFKMASGATMGPVGIGRLRLTASL